MATKTAKEKALVHLSYAEQAMAAIKYELGSGGTKELSPDLYSNYSAIRANMEALRIKLAKWK